MTRVIVKHWSFHKSIGYGVDTVYTPKISSSHINDITYAACKGVIMYDYTLNNHIIWYDSSESAINDKIL